MGGLPPVCTQILFGQYVREKIANWPCPKARLTSGSYWWCCVLIHRKFCHELGKLMISYNLDPHRIPNLPMPPTHSWLSNPLTHGGLPPSMPPGWSSWPCSRPLAALESSPSGLKSQPLTPAWPSPLRQAGAADQPLSVVTQALRWNHEWFSALKQGYLHRLNIKEGPISKFKTCKVY